MLEEQEIKRAGEIRSDPSGVDPAWDEEDVIEKGGSEFSSPKPSVSPLTSVRVSVLPPSSPATAHLLTFFLVLCLCFR